MVRRLIGTLVAATAIGALVAGCGGSDPKQDYISKGDEICAKGTFQIAVQARQIYGQAAPPPQDAAKFASDVAVPGLTDVLNQLRALKPPEGDAQKTAAIYDALQRGIDTLKADPSLYSEPDTGGAFDQANSLAQAYGFKECGSSAQSSGT
jgi:hypothetical protein